ncbi:single-stranded-DNA-specific exonuclease RecJ [Candidatus Gracilibacteria bacterium]|nr:single-stranded-DNA-specific exonuclease RecJ [Candidatus Gracilibacteria bacterium]NJM87257.1 single-stranded-DNA-specific exonuclease RecJ [Hydrococcus sp. RU_2_2]
MVMLQPQWQVIPSQPIPEWFLETVKLYAPESDGRYAAQILWQRGICTREQLIQFLDPNAYQPTSSFAFGQEMKWAIQRLLKARDRQEKIAIWGDFDADGITSTSVLWEGLGQFFPQHLQLNYYIPNRISESHGLNCLGIERLAIAGIKLIVTCDTGSTNLKEIDYANQLGIDIIVTDHHSLPEERPSVVSIINPRYFAENHPLYHLSGVAVAYKLVEALYQVLPDVPQQPVEELLDLVTIGLIADLVQLSGDCRYLAQKGLQKLTERLNNKRNPIRPGVTFLLELCNKSGDRPTDISFGLGPRINAVSRIHGEASFCVELLTSRDSKHCKKLAEAAELANTRRKALQKDVVEQVKKKLSQLDLSTTSVIVLDDPQWQSGILGLVASQIAQEYNRPTILLSTATNETNNSPKLARGSARSIKNIDLYELLKTQANLLHKFGGHPFAAGLSFPVENLPLFREAIEYQLRQQLSNIALMTSTIEADLVVTISALGKLLFKELKLVEPCGMGNPTPKLLIKNCWFEEVSHRNTKDLHKKPVTYIKTTFKICDDSATIGFPGGWWGHYQDEIPQQQRCDAIVELDFNNYSNCHEVRLIAVRTSIPTTEFRNSLAQDEYLFDYRNRLTNIELLDCRILQACPTSWNEIHREYRNAIAREEKLALAYTQPQLPDPQQIWQQLLGIAKYLGRTGKVVTLDQLKKKLSLSDRTLNFGLKALAELGFIYNCSDCSIEISYSNQFSSEQQSAIAQGIATKPIAIFLEAVREEHFQRQYFSQIPLATLKGHLLAGNSNFESHNLL